MDEKQEIQWVKDTYDLSGNNGSVKEPQITRLAGTWVSPQVALELGTAYALGGLINAVVEASPDPNGNYRRSGKAAAAGSTNTPKAATATITTTASTQTNTSATIVVVSKPPAAKSLPTPSPTAAVPPAKRRKESSPVPTPQSSKPPSRASPAPSKTAAPRRSTRTKSPAPHSAAAIAPLTSVNRTPKAPRSSPKKAAIASTSLTPGGSDLTAVDEEGELVKDDVAGAELREQDIEEQKKLIEDLKQKRNQEEGQMDTEELSSSKKRDREEGDKPLEFQFKEPETEERAIATNSRVGRFHLEPRAKSFAWGVAAFAVGMGAV
jgi:hypothetical protein